MQGSSQEMNIKSNLVSGLSRRVLLALITAILFFVPVNIYTYFVLGQVIGGTVGVVFLTILFAEIMKLLGADLSKQETLLLYYAAGWAGVSLPIYTHVIIYRSYVIRTPFAWTYTINGVPIAELVPSWIVPPHYLPTVRSLFQIAYVPSLTVWTLWWLLCLLIDISLAITMARIYVIRLNYPFPFYAIDVSVASYVSERRVEFIKYFTPAFSLGLVWALIAYIPAFLGTPVIPIPFYDLTWAIQEVLPGGLFGIMTTLSSYITGILMPFEGALWALISSIVIWTVFNSLFVTTFPDVFPEWAQEYMKGMGLITVQNRSYMRVWFGPQVGFALATALYYLILKSRKAFISALREIFAFKKETDKDTILPSMKISLLLFLISALAGVFLHHALIPEMPIWLPIFYSIIFSFFTAIMITAMRGEVGFVPPGIPGWTWHALVYLTPYQGYAGYILISPYGGLGASSFSQQVKAALAIGARPYDLIKLWIIGALLAQLTSLLALDLFWRMAPIPSAAYPYTIYDCISTAYADALITTRQLRVNLQTISIPAVVLFLMLLFGDQVLVRLGIPFSGIGLVMGLYSPPTYTLAMFIGSALARVLLPRLLGISPRSPRWMQIAGYLVMGELCGEGFIAMLGACINLIYKSSWLWPY